LIKELTRESGISFVFSAKDEARFRMSRGNKDEPRATACGQLFYDGVPLLRMPLEQRESGNPVFHPLIKELTRESGISFVFSAKDEARSTINLETKQAELSFK
jgi:hypothetical protein